MEHVIELYGYWIEWMGLCGKLYERLNVYAIWTCFRNVYEMYWIGIEWINGYEIEWMSEWMVLDSYEWKV